MKKEFTGEIQKFKIQRFNDSLVHPNIILLGIQEYIMVK